MTDSPGTPNSKLVETKQRWAREGRALDQPGFWETRGYHNEGDP